MIALKTILKFTASGNDSPIQPTLEQCKKTHTHAHTHTHTHTQYSAKSPLVESYTDEP